MGRGTGVNRGFSCFSVWWFHEATTTHLWRLPNVSFRVDMDQNIYDILREQLRVLSQSDSLRRLGLTGVFITVESISWVYRSNRVSSYVDRRDIFEISAQVPLSSDPNSRSYTVKQYVMASMASHDVSGCSRSRLLRGHESSETSLILSSKVKLPGKCRGPV